MVNGNAITPISPANWAALIGAWAFDGKSARYLGPAGTRRNGHSDATTTASHEAPLGSPYGIAVGDIRLTDGTIRSVITFTALDEAEQTTGGIVLGYESQNESYIIVQLGAYNAGYAISEFVPGSGWRALARAGSIQNLSTSHPYALELTQIGQELTMRVDGVRVFRHILPKPPAGDQVGLFGWGTKEIEFSGLSIEQELPRAFVAMQFGPPHDTIYEELIRPVTESAKFEVIRADELRGPGIIFEDVKREITQAKVVIAEITPANPNVFYELGYAHALNKSTILLARSERDPLPFDIASYRVIFYEDTIRGKPVVEKSLRKHLASILGDSSANS